MRKNVKILFIGNSLTYYNLLPLCVKRFFADAGVTAECIMQTCGGKCLDYHCGRGDTEMNVKYGKFDYVVLQGKSSGFDPSAFLPAGESIIKDLVYPAGSTPVLYMTWALKGDRKGQAPITKAYEDLAASTGAVLAPVGVAWKRAMRIRPAIELFAPDGNHPSPAGTYLAAAVIFASIEKRSRSIKLTDDGFYREYGLDRESAAKINRIAIETAAGYRAE